MGVKRLKDIPGFNIDRVAAAAGCLGCRSGPEVTASVDSTQDGVDTRLQIGCGRIPVVGGVNERVRSPRLGLRDRRPGHGRWKRSVLRRSARSNASSTSPLRMRRLV